MHLGELLKVMEKVSPFVGKVQHSTSPEAPECWPQGAKDFKLNINASLANPIDLNSLRSLHFEGREEPPVVAEESHWGLRRPRGASC